ncbi:MAG: Arc family DNA-binding protein [Fimbriiglobus sp.]|jgi:hypothetical protein|nr:Arc family DNA-binding protein [Fimbriiglobus sp.]
MPKKEATKFLLRLDPTVMAAVKRWAEAELRSVNGQIEYILRDALTRRGVKLTDPEAAEEERPPDGT